MAFEKQLNVAKSDLNTNAVVASLSVGTKCQRDFSTCTKQTTTGDFFFRVRCRYSQRASSTTASTRGGSVVTARIGARTMTARWREAAHCSLYLRTLGRSTPDNRRLRSRFLSSLSRAERLWLCAYRGLRPM